MPTIPRSFIDDLLDRTDIVALIDARVPLRKQGKDYGACCPFHTEKTPSFTVSPTKQFYYCFGCHASGNAIGFLMEHEHMGYVESVEALAQQAGMQVPRDAKGAQRAAQQHKNQNLYDLQKSVAQFYAMQLRQHPKGSEAIEYLKGRGLSGEVAKQFMIGFAPPGWENVLGQFGNDLEQRRALEKIGLVLQKDGGGKYDRFRNRIMFPIRDRRGRVVAFGGRVLGDEQPKYLNSPETPLFHKGEMLYGVYEMLQAARHPSQILMVEGYMDVVALAQHGVNNAVAALGTAISPQHLTTLFRLAQELVFCFDGDSAGRDAAKRALELCLPHMEAGLQARFLFLPEGEDPDSLIRKIGQAQFTAQVQQAKPLSEFLLSTLMQQVDRQSIDGQARLVKLAAPLFAKIPEGTFRHLLIGALAGELKMEEALLQQRLSATSGTSASSSAASQGASAAGRRGAPAKQQQAPRSKPATPIRFALALLLQYPTLAEAVTDSHIDMLENTQLPGVRLLIQALEITRKQPNISTGALLERWRDTKEGEQLARLAVWQLVVPNTGIKEEFLGALARMKQAETQQLLDNLLEKSKKTPLDLQEKQTLQALLAASE